MTDTLPERAKKLLDGTELVVLTTLNADGTPHSSPVWAMRDGDDILMSTVASRVKARNLERDPRACAVVIDSVDPICYFSINGSVTLTPDEDKRLLDELSRKYLGQPYPQDDSANVRLVLRLRPDRVTGQYEPAR